MYCVKSSISWTSLFNWICRRWFSWVSFRIFSKSDSEFSSILSRSISFLLDFVFWYISNKRWSFLSFKSFSNSIDEFSRMPLDKSSASYTIDVKSFLYCNNVSGNVTSNSCNWEMLDISSCHVCMRSVSLSMRNSSLTASRIAWTYCR